MNKSETIGKLAEALSKLQGEVQDAHKDKQGYGYRYADLSSVLDIARPLCMKYGLAVSQLCDNNTNDPTPNVGVETVLMHSSGEWISSTLYMPITQGKGMSGAQAAGSIITYARRYALAAILGIAQTDDDASIKNAISDESNKIKVGHMVPDNVDMISLETVSSILCLIESLNIKDEEVKKWLNKAQVSDISCLSAEQGEKLLAMLEKRGNN